GSGKVWARRACVRSLRSVCRIRRLPGKMLSAIEADHLSRNRTRLQEPSYRGPEFRKSGRALQANGFGLAAVSGLALAVIGKGRARPDAVDPNARGERLRHRLRRGPERRFRQGVGEI